MENPNYIFLLLISFFTISDPESISGMLKCGNCSKQMEKPKMLPCQHTFCNDCLSNNMKIKTFSEKNHIKCKICEKYHQLPRNGTDGFPNNRALLDLQALNQQTTVAVKCEYFRGYSEGSNDSDVSID